MGDFVEAVKNINSIKPENCRKWGMNFSLDKVSMMYDKYFNDVLNVYTGKGWYADSNKLSLDALKRNYPCLQ